MADPDPDDVLAATLGHLRDAEGATGVVGAAVVDGADVVHAASRERADGRYVHAERAALARFVGRHGEPGDDAVVVTTLSPCEADDDRRVGASCTDLLRGAGEADAPVDRVHAGFLDPWQPGVETYREAGLEVETTDDPVLGRACERLFEFFRDLEAVDDVDAFVRAATAGVDARGSAGERGSPGRDDAVRGR